MQAEDVGGENAGAECANDVNACAMLPIAICTDSAYQPDLCSRQFTLSNDVASHHDRPSMTNRRSQHVTMYAMRTSAGRLGCVPSNM